MNGAVSIPAQENAVGQLMESVLIKGDLSKLSPQERGTYYMEVCRSVGLNPLTKPFEYITLNGKLTLYALRTCTDQLRAIHNVSVVELTETERDSVFIVTAKVVNGAGRTDASKGAVNISGLKGEALANALMKAETKAKRRATLSICGLGLLDESEVETIDGAVKGPPAAVPAPTLITHQQAASGEVIEPKRSPVPSASAPAIDTGKPHPLLHGDPSLNTPEKWTEAFISKIASSSIEDLAEWDRLNETALGKIHANYNALYKKIEAAVTARQNAISNSGATTPDAGTAPAAKRPPIAPAAGATPSDGVPDYKVDANGWLDWADKLLGSVTDASMLEATFNEKIEPHRNGLFPPDQDTLLSIYGRHEKRLGID